MSQPRKSKTNTTIPSVASTAVEKKCPYLSLTVKEIGNLPNVAIGQTSYILNLSSTLEGTQFQAIDNRLLYPCQEKVTHRTEWKWQLNLPFLKRPCDFSNLSTEFLVVQLIEEVGPPANPSESTNLVTARVTELGSLVITIEELLLNEGSITKTQIFHGEEVVPLKATWTNSPFIKYNLSLAVDILTPPDFKDSTALEITFDGILNLPIEENEYDLILELSLPYSDDNGETFYKPRFETTAKRSIYKSFSKLARYPENIKYTKCLVDSKRSLQDYYLPPDTILREKFEDNTFIAQNTYQRFLFPTNVLKSICEQEQITMELILNPKMLTKTSKKTVFTGNFCLKTFLEKETTNYKAIVPFSEQISDKDGYNAVVLLDFNLSSQISNEPFIDPQIEINAAKYAREKAICEQNISKYLKMKCQDFVQNYQRNFKLKYLKQSENLTNLKAFDNFYIYSEKHFLTAAVNYLSVSRAKYGNFRDIEVRKKCFIDVCDFTEDVVFKLDERALLPTPCEKELFEMGYIDEANGIYIMVRLLSYV